MQTWQGWEAGDEEPISSPTKFWPIIFSHQWEKWVWSITYSIFSQVNQRQSDFPDRMDNVYEWALLESPVCSLWLLLASALNWVYSSNRNKLCCIEFFFFLNCFLSSFSHAKLISCFTDPACLHKFEDSHSMEHLCVFPMCLFHFVDVVVVVVLFFYLASCWTLNFEVWLCML